MQFFSDLVGIDFCKIPLKLSWLFSATLLELYQFKLIWIDNNILTISFKFWIGLTTIDGLCRMPRATRTTRRYSAGVRSVSSYRWNRSGIEQEIWTVCHIHHQLPSGPRRDRCWSSRKCCASSDAKRRASTTKFTTDILTVTSTPFLPTSTPRIPERFGPIFSIISFEFLEPFISMNTSNDLFLFPLQLIKVDTSKKTCLTWAEPNVYASEPVFIAHPDAKVLL